MECSKSHVAGDGDAQRRLFDVSAEISEQIRADEDTAGRVYAALNADPIDFYSHVDVRVNSGVVHLSGYIWGSDAIFTAKQIAAKVPGVSRVVNEMEFEPESERSGGGARSR